MRFKEIVKEIDAGSGIRPISFSPEILSNSVQFSHVDNEEILLYQDGNIALFFIVKNDKYAYVAVELTDNDWVNLRQIHNETGISGMITMILTAIISNGNKIRIIKHEPLTHYGLKWIKRLIKNPRGLVITDQLDKEWGDAWETGISGGTEILIESTLFNLAEMQKKWKDSTLIKPAYRFKYGKELL